MTAPGLRGTPGTRPLIRLLRTLAACALISAALTGCAAFGVQPDAVSSRPPASSGTAAPQPTSHKVPPPDATDAARLRTLADDPLFRGGRQTLAAPAPSGSSGYNVMRGDVATALLTGKEPFEKVSIATARAQLERVRAAGWTIVGVECTVDPDFTSARIYAVKNLGSFTGALMEDVSSSALTTSGFVPYHAEKPNPWTPAPGSASANTCIDGPSAPTETTQSLITNISAKAVI